MKIVKTGAFFIDYDETLVQKQAEDVKSVIKSLLTEFGDEIILDTDDDTLNQIVQLWIQSMSSLRIPLLVSSSDEHGILVNNIKFDPHQEMSTKAQLFAFIKTLADKTITDIQGNVVSVDELLQILDGQKSTIRPVNLGLSLINDNNVEHNEGKMLKDLYHKDETVDDYVLSFHKSLTAGEMLFDKLAQIDEFVVPTSKDVRRDLAQFLILNYRIQLAKIVNNHIPVLYMPDVDNAFSIFSIIDNDEIIIEKWTNRKFVPVNIQALTHQLLDNSLYNDDVKNIPRLPTADDPNGSIRSLIKGQNPKLNDGFHYFDVITG